MKPVPRSFAVLCSILATVTVGCEEAATPAPPRTAAPTDPVTIVAAVTVPGNAIQSGTKSWVDDATKRYYLTDVSNAGVDVIDATTYAYVGRVTGFVGSTGVAGTSGPNSIVFTGDGKAWVTDGISGVRVVDLGTLTISATISTAIAACDNGTVRNCQRTNEISYDPEHKIIFVQNPSPLDLAGNAIDTYGVFISAVPPYPVLGTITFVDRRNQEAPLWDPVQHRFLTAVAGRLVGTTVYDQYVAVIDPTVRPFTMEKKFPINCFALGLTPTPGGLFGINDPALGPNGKMVIPGCGKALIMDTQTGAVTPILQIGGGNQTWYNSGDGRYYVTGVDITTGANSLGIINAATGTWIQSVVALQATNPTAYAATNTIFAVVQITAAQAATPATDTSECIAFNVAGRGCILVFKHTVNAAPPFSAMRRALPADGGYIEDDDS
ncbi:MAG: hypothetical protein EXR93_11515 [Gemmatimonadetes bacterium]|nr:hypothetical protein [Gemmatimonadota bacterium]